MSNYPQAGRGRGRGRGRGDDGGPPSQGGFDRGRGRGQSGGGGYRGSGGGQGGGGGFRGGPGGGPGRGRGRAPLEIFAPGLSTDMETRLSVNEQNTLIRSFSQLSVSSPRVFRPGWGTLGREIKVRANFFVLKYQKNSIMYDYAVKFKPDIVRLHERLFELLENSPEFAPFRNDIAHDGHQRLISRRPLQLPPSIELPFYEEGQDGPNQSSRIYSVTFEKPRQLKASDLDRYLAGNDPDYDSGPIIAAFNLLTSYRARRNGVRYGQNRYFFGDDPIPLAQGLVAWKGFFCSVRPVYKQLMVNVNVCMSAFHVPQRNLAEAYMDFNRQSRGAVPNFLTDKVKIVTTHLGYRKKSKIIAFKDESAKRLEFPCTDYGGTKISVEQYFRRKYNIRLTYPDLPVINIGSSRRDVYVPLEICELMEGEPFRGVLDERAISEMIKIACNPPAVNARSITEEGLQKLGFRQQTSPMDTFNLSVEKDMAVVPARLLPPPTVTYRSGKPRVADGSWNILDVKFHRGAELTKWVVLVAQDGGRDDFQTENDPALIEIVQGFMAKCTSSGMNVAAGKPPFIFFSQLPKASKRDPFRQEAFEEIEKRLKALPSAPNMVLVFLSQVEKHIYPGLKKLCDVKLGVPTVCMLNPKVRRDPQRRDQYFSNVALKVNAKLGGINHQLDAESVKWLKDTMLVGIDVTHPGFGTKPGTPSIVAMVASCDSTFMQYPASIQLREHRIEITADESKILKDMMVERLLTYKRKMNVLPSRIIVFRDGVSEGQFHLINKHELPPIQAAFRGFPNYNPKLTIVICGKRHHARMFATDAADTDKTSNTKAGMVVDRGITDVYDFDFYLQAHAGLQGTTRSTHYTVIYDENKLSADDIQQGTNKLCYLWARATKSVSLAPPAYWADIACERGRFYIREILPPGRDSPDNRLDEAGMKKRAEQLWGQGVHARLKDTMFFL